MVAEEIKNGSVDEKFKVNFLLLMGNTLLHTFSNGLIHQKLVLFKGDIDHYDGYNWCAYRLESLKVSKTEWAKDPSTKYFCGPLVFLVLFYVDRVKIKIKNHVSRTIPRFLPWTEQNLRLRETLEINEDLFGRGKKREREVISDDEGESSQTDAEIQVQEKMIKDLELSTFILSESRKKYEFANKTFDGNLILCLQSAALNGNEQFLKRIEKAQEVVWTQNTHYEENANNIPADCQEPRNEETNRTGNIQEPQGNIEQDNNPDDDTTQPMI
ncbi:hypothetical protein POM88_041214 [Heracleum sosnowskyi]|uniref:Uncharacterized protein n=1 Tax=Heracleum sosnowskyi TaxID=360622 RepID=A0AAD8HG77_9APIA|nr:hypothetical protein POM88_041214 [Heracleum sosnowskyi]